MIVLKIEIINCWLKTKTHVSKQRRKIVFRLAFLVDNFFNRGITQLFIYQLSCV